MRILICALILFVGQSALGQSFFEEGIKINRERDFKGEALYGFMNGGSELFLEYGFKELKALELEYHGEAFSVEIYIMDSPENAFGIYSQHTFRCNPADDKFTLDCSSPGQYQVVSGNIYLSVVSEKRGEGYQMATYELAEIFTKRYKSSEDLSLPGSISRLKESGVNISNSVKYAIGPIALSNSLSAYMPLFENIKSYKVWIVLSKGIPASASVKFNSAEDLEKFSLSCADSAAGLKVEKDLNESLTLILRFPVAS